MDIFGNAKDFKECVLNKSPHMNPTGAFNIHLIKL